MDAGQIYYAGTLLGTTGLNNHDASLVSGFLFTWFFVACGSQPLPVV